MSLDEQFEKIAQEASEKAASVTCSIGEYQDGLGLIIETLQIDIQASKESDSGD
jgi:hypothetical protein